MIEQIKRLAATTLNLTDEQIAEILYEPDGTTPKTDFADKLIELNAQRIAKLKDEHKAELTLKFNDGHAKATGESLSKYEKRIKEEFGIQSDATGNDLLKEIIAKHAKVELDEEKIKLHPMYLELERKINNDYVPKEKYTEIETTFNEFKDQLESNKVKSVVKQDAIKIFRSLHPVLPKDPVKATNQESDFVAKLINFDYELVDDGNHVIKINGKRLENANGFPVTFADFVKSEANKSFDFEIQDNRNNAGNNNSGNNGTSLTLPQTEQEYTVMLANADPVTAVKLMNAWKAKNAK